MLSEGVRERIGRAVGAEVQGSSRLAGGCVGEVRRVELAGGASVVAKLCEASVGDAPGLDLEGWMLEELRERGTPVPRVFLAEPDLLVMELVPGETGCRREAGAGAAGVLAALHGNTWDRFGLDRDTLIGGRRQVNTPEASWIDFFREHRLLNMGRRCVEAERAPEDLLPRLERLGDRLPKLLHEPEAPALLHGDLWGGNILTRGERVTGLIDPAISYGHPEMELAFTSLFSTFSQGFYDRYHAERRIRRGFFEERAALYNLYPLLVHVRLFGGSYLGQVERTLSRFRV